MQAETLVKEGKLEEALADLQSAVKAKPAEAKLRVFLFQLLAVMGRWDRALTQLNVAAEMDAANLLMAEMCRPALACEAFREQVFTGDGGGKTPLVLGEPEEWVGWMIQANTLAAQGKYDEAAALRDKALEAAPAVSGKVVRWSDEEGAEGEGFEWIMDADSRLGPILELMMNGKYYWAPMHRLHQIALDKPADLRDAVWLPAQITFASGGVKPALIPSRYAGTEASADGAQRLARATAWDERPGGLFAGLGGRVFATSEGEVGMMEVRTITLGDKPAGV